MPLHYDCVIPPDHPCLPGHFPGNPLVPGVVILDQVLAAAARLRPELRVVGVPQVKFVQPLRPGQPLRIELTEQGDTRLRFHCRTDGGDIAQGVLSLAPRS